MGPWVLPFPETCDVNKQKQKRNSSNDGNYSSVSCGDDNNNICWKVLIQKWNFSAFNTIASQSSSRESVVLIQTLAYWGP